MEKDGRSRRDHIERLIDQTKDEARKAELEAELWTPPFPVPLAYLWSIFLRLHSRRGFGDYSPLPLRWADIDAFARLTKTELQPWEIEVIEMLDDVFLDASSGKVVEADREKKPAQRKLTPAVFDAMFGVTNSLPC